MYYIVIYDGLCNLCTSLVQLLERLDGGQNFRYLPMQDGSALGPWNVQPGDCEAGVILIDREDRNRRWQGSEATEEIARLLPGGELFIGAYRALPGLKGLGDRCYLQIRDNRYDWFGERSLYRSAYPPDTRKLLGPAR